MLSDALYYSNNETQPWLIYYISKPLIGVYEQNKIVPGSISAEKQRPTSPPGESRFQSLRKKDIRSFEELLVHFPMIARQLHVGLERVIAEFGKELGRPLPAPPSLTNGNDQEGLPIPTNQEGLPFTPSEFFEDDEDYMRRALETAVMTAIDLFRQVDKQQLSLLGATTSLTGPLVERMIERYIAQQVHSSLLFPRLCGFHRTEDLKLDAHIRQMDHIDASQVGILIENGKAEKEEIIRRVGQGVDVFRKIVDADCPQEMLQILLATVKAVSADAEAISTEKRPWLLITADVLVALLLMVVVRSQVRHLQARLIYMQQFIYIDDVESGEFGYSLSTFEAVLTYLLHDSLPLRKMSAQNKRLWQATKSGQVTELKRILEPDSQSEDQGNEFPTLEDEPSRVNGDVDPPESPGLAHVFPFQTWNRPAPQKGKKVSMDIGSISEASTTSVLSRATTIGSTTSAIEGDTSVANLTKTQDAAGDSVPMMAVEADQPRSLKYLLGLREYYSVEDVLEDTNSDGTTLLSAAVQLSHTEIADILLDYIYEYCDAVRVNAYFSKGDVRGRTVGHYLFSVPSLTGRIGDLIPWTQKDRNGQTPLFALCRSYDHPDYSTMVNEALTIATTVQGDGQGLRLDQHVDGRGNTLLHIVSDVQIARRILKECDCDPNATNDKRFTPLMMASKYGRVDLVRTLFLDPRVDIYLRETRGLTAVELAKDDEVRNKIDDLILFRNPPASPADASRRVTAVVRSLFMEDGSLRFIIKSAAPNAADSGSTYTVTTCRRTLADFENLVRFLRVEHPASYIPELPHLPNPFLMQSKPSRAVLHELQERLDLVLKMLLDHPTFSTHEMLWEFFLVPEMQPAMLEERSWRKAAALAEDITDEYAPATREGVRDVEQTVAHAQEAISSVDAAYRVVLRRGYTLLNAAADFSDAIALCVQALITLPRQPPLSTTGINDEKSTVSSPNNPCRVPLLPPTHTAALSRYAAAIAGGGPPPLHRPPLAQFLTHLAGGEQASAMAVLAALRRPADLATTVSTEVRSLARAQAAAAAAQSTYAATVRSGTQVPSQSQASPARSSGSGSASGSDTTTSFTQSLSRRFNFTAFLLEEPRARAARETSSRATALAEAVDRSARELAWNGDVVVGELAGWTGWRERACQVLLREMAAQALVRERERGKRLERCLAAVKGVGIRV